MKTEKQIRELAQSIKDVREEYDNQFDLAGNTHSSWTALEVIRWILEEPRKWTSED